MLDQRGQTLFLQHLPVLLHELTGTPAGLPNKISTLPQARAGKSRPETLAPGAILTQSAANRVTAQYQGEAEQRPRAMRAAANH